MLAIRDSIAAVPRRWSMILILFIPIHIFDVHFHLDLTIKNRGWILAYPGFHVEIGIIQCPEFRNTVIHSHYSTQEINSPWEGQDSLLKIDQSLWFG
jgi:hypothetical protein